MTDNRKAAFTARHAAGRRRRSCSRRRRRRAASPGAAAARSARAGAGGSPARRPHIVVIWGDDVGFWNISYNSRGMMGFRTPNIDRIFQEGMTFTDYYAEQSCTAGRSAFITGQATRAHRPVQSRPARCGGRHEGRGPDHRHDPEGHGLRDRTVRQEPPRRPRRAPADRARLRRVLRQPLPPQCRGGAGERRTTRRIRTSAAASARAA